MGREYPMDMVDAAEERYCVDRKPMREVAEATAVPESTLWRWAKRYGWTAKRDEIQKARKELRMDMVLLRAKRIRDCLNNSAVDPMDLFAVAKLEEIEIASRKLAMEERAAGLGEIPVSLPDVATPEQIADAMERAVRIKLGRMLANPEETDLAAIKNVRQALDVIAAMRPQDDQPADPARGLSKATADAIIEKVLGKVKA